MTERDRSRTEWGRVDAEVPLFSSQKVRRTDEFSIFAAAVQGQLNSDLRYLHAPATSVRVASAKLQPDINSFGIQSRWLVEHFSSGVFNMREAESIVLHHAIFSPRSASVAKPGLGLYDQSVENYLRTKSGLQSLTALDPLYRIDEEGKMRFSDEVQRLQWSAEVAIPVCGTGYNNYGHFLYDGLPNVLMLLSILDRDRVCIVGPPHLAPWQREILTALNLLPLHRPLSQPMVFRKIVASSLLSLHVAYPTRFVRPVFDMLRFRFGGGRASARKLFVSRLSYPDRRTLTNRAEVEALFREESFEIVHPERLAVAAQARLFASASFVAGESGAGLANIGFCDPGTKVLEIQPEQFTEGWTRASCMIFGHRWHIYIAPSAGDKQTMTWTADVDSLRAAIRKITQD